jgi:hypothetical protein
MAIRVVSCAGVGVNRLLLAGGVVFGAMLAPAAAADMPKSRIG